MKEHSKKWGDLFLILSIASFFVMFVDAVFFRKDGGEFVEFFLLAIMMRYGIYLSLSMEYRFSLTRRRYLYYLNRNMIVLLVASLPFIVKSVGMYYLFPCLWGVSGLFRFMECHEFDA